MKDSQFRLAAIVESSDDAIISKTLDGVITSWNPGAERIFGYAAEEVVGEPITTIIPPGRIDEESQIQAKIARNERVDHFETERQRKDGVTIAVSVTVSPLRDSSGKIIGMSKICRDITESKKKEKELHRLNRTLKALRASSKAITRATREREYLEEVCRIVIEDCGHAMVWIGFAGDDKDKSVRPVAHAGFEEGYIETLNITWKANTKRGKGPTGTAIRTGKPTACRNMLTDPAFGPWREEALKRGYASSLALPLMADGKAFGALTLYSREPDSFAEDEVKLLTELADDLAFGITAIRLRLEFASSTERLQVQATALESAANAIAITNPKGVIEWVNGAFTQLTGYSAAEAVGQNPRALKSGRHEPEFYTRMWKTILAGRVWHGTLVNKRKDGGLYTEEMTITPVTDAGKITHFIAIKQDVTDRQRAEEEIRKLNTELVERVRVRTAELKTSNRELEAFCYSVSHDLRAPLRAINGFSRVLIEDYADKLDATGIDCLNRMTEGCRRMAQLIDDLLNLSRHTRAEMRRQPVNLSKLAREVANELQEQAPKRAVEVHIAAGVKAVGDPALLRVALSNLLANAWKFTSKGAKAAIEFGVKKTASGAIYFVRDNGAGFEMAYADKLFKPFQRLHGLKEFSGTGIGLATVERIVRRHGGRVWAEAVVDRGATFYFTLEPEREQNG